MFLLSFRCLEVTIHKDDHGRGEVESRFMHRGLKIIFETFLNLDRREWKNNNSHVIFIGGCKLHLSYGESQGR